MNPVWRRCPECGLRGPRDKKGGDPAEWPEDLRVRKFPEVKAGVA